MAEPIRQHVPVLPKEVLSLFPTKSKIIIDGTLGDGSHAELILNEHPTIELYLGLDKDVEAITRAEQRLKPFGEKVRCIHAGFEDITQVAQALQLEHVDAILLDLGFSDPQIQSHSRGFSFEYDAPLDMRFDDSKELTAETIINTWSENDLLKLFSTIGEERNAKLFASRIVQARKEYRIRTTAQLVDILRAGLQTKLKTNKEIPWTGGIHFATKVFQSLRIAVNDEFGVLQKALPQAVSLLRTGGRLLVITFHSGEDRIVKNYFRQESHDCICPPTFPACVCNHHALLRLLTKKPLQATDAEKKAYPKSRSAKLRVAEKI